MITHGTLLQNRYRIAKRIGQGGMGAVYVATDERFGSTVAIKQTFFDDSALRKAFEREAHLLNHLRHGALPKVSDHFIEDDGQFLVMEYIEGCDLHELLQERGGAFPIADVLKWADELLDALDYLHTHTPPIIHRDIKPQNLKLTARGQIVLLDFGLAKATPSETRSDVTASVFGYSRNYAPLEQINGTGTDARSDLYSLAATLYHLLTGTPPPDALTRASAVINNHPDPLRPAHLVHPQVPVMVSQLLNDAMAQNAARRPGAAAEMRAALRRLASVNTHVAQRATEASSLRSGAHVTDEATVLEPLAGSLNAPTSASVTHRAAHLPLQQPRHAAAHGDATVIDRPGMNKTQDTTVVRRVAAPPARRSSARVPVVAFVVLFVACSVAAFMFSRRSGTTAPMSEGHSDTPLAATSVAQPAVPSSPQSDGGAFIQNNVHASEESPAHTQLPSARADSRSTASTQDATPEAGAGNAAERSIVTDDSNRPTPISGTQANRPALVIHAPAPSTPPADDSVQSDDGARRAEEPSSPQTRPLPPPRGDDFRPPPYDPARRPPPHHRPPFP